MHEDGLARLQAPAQRQREVGGVVVEDQPGTLGEVELARQREGEELGRNGRLGEAADGAEGRHTLAGLDLRACGSAAHDPGHLAAGDEGQGRFHLILAARLQELGEGDAGALDVDDDALAGREHVRGLGLGHLDQRERAVGTALLHDLDGPHRGDYVRAASAGAHRLMLPSWA